MFDDFVATSETLTGFSAYDLRATGQAQPYLDTMLGAVGEDTVVALLAAHGAAVAGADRAMRTLRREVLSDPRLGPVARNLIKMWYVGTWYEMPAIWHERYGVDGDGRRGTFVVSPEAYTEGLLWPAIGANPSGAKPFGYGMWAMPPRVTPS